MSADLKGVAGLQDMPIGAALRLVGSRGTLTLTSQKPIVTIESYRPQTIRQCLSWVINRPDDPEI